MITQAIARRRRPRGLHPRRTDGETQTKRLPEYLEAEEVDTIIRAARTLGRSFCYWSIGHSSIQTALIYLELVPEPTGSLIPAP